MELATTSTAPTTGVSANDEKFKIASRLSPEFVHAILAAFNSGKMDAATACERLQIGRSRLYTPRSQWLRNGKQPDLSASGGNRVDPWPDHILSFLREFLPHCRPINFALIADELDRRFGLSVPAPPWPERYELTFPRLSLPRRRWQCAANCGDDGWCAFVPVIDCCTREILGWALESTARTKTAERALEEALLTRFGWTHGAPKGLMLRHDNGLVFGSKTYRGLVKDYGISQEYTAPYTPEQNGLCERFIRSFKEECAWITSFASLAEARAKIATYIHHYNHRRPHQALNYLTPNQYHQELCLVAA